MRRLLGPDAPAIGADHPVRRVLRTGRPEVSNAVPADFVAAAAPNPAHREVLTALGPRAYVCVPMAARGRVLGVISLLTGAAGRQYGPADVALAEALATRAALAVDNARLHQEVQAAGRTRDEFLAAASHDLKNPLTLVKATSQMLQRRVLAAGLNEPGRVAAGLASIEAAATRMSHLLDALLDMARLQIGQPLALERRPTDLAALARQVAAEVQQATDRHELRVEAPSSLVGSWDAARLERVLSNLLDNAVKYSPDGGPIVLTVAHEPADAAAGAAGTAPDGSSAPGAPPTDGGGASPDSSGPAAAPAGDGAARWAVLAVRDPGVGIPPDDLPRVFERFHRGANVVGRIRGTGLGLAGARQIVEQHGGTIAVASPPGAGTTVTLRLPLADSPPKAG
jgi:signal transduction histidine kinase